MVGVRSALLQLARPAAMVTSTHRSLHVLPSLPVSLPSLRSCPEHHHPNHAADWRGKCAGFPSGHGYICPLRPLHPACPALSHPLCCCPLAQNITTLTMLLTGGGDALTPPAALVTSSCSFRPTLPPLPCFCAQNITTPTVLLTGGVDVLAPPAAMVTSSCSFRPTLPSLLCFCAQNITTPTVLLTGGVDVLAPPAAMDRMRKVMGDAGSLAGWLHTPDYGHMVREGKLLLGRKKALRLHCASSSPLA